MNDHVSTSDSAGRNGRGGSRRADSARAPRERYEDEDVNTDRGADEGADGSRTRRGGKARRRGADGRGGAPGGRTARGRRPGRSGAGADPVSRFSASALRRVSVLGDRPSQVVYTLAEQSRRKNGTAVLAGLLVLCLTSLVGLLGVLSYQLATQTGGTSSQAAVGSVVAPPEGHSTLLPEMYQAQPQDEAFEPIAERGEGSGGLPEDGVFGSETEELELDGQKLVRDQSEVTDTCTSLVWGREVAQTLVDGECTSAASAVYLSGGEKYIAQFTLFDLADVDAATNAATALDPQDPSIAPGFLLPRKSGVEGLHEGYSQATAQVMGHYLAVYWVARTDGEKPGESDTLSTLNVAAMNASTWVYRQVGEAEQ
ncbi:hypothetical protein [Streptomonospora litoralis]|uniref:Uncharacterized protein n=1 Tax=Streptomonospora litoralis TaxID=2498135 RepID=A0A4P6Q1I1_9ACTN|nr:hypothetical protein [Streptomonospora litoralis]QBI53950.1 hypothetical protein EKD16_10820 [Streptomonospora litoralis]